MEKTSCLDKRMYELSKLGGVFEILLISIAIFLTPLILPQILNAVFGATSAIASNSQYVVGAIINASLIVAGVNVKGWKKIIGIVMLPSITAMLSGLVFNIASIFTVYMIPAIWLGNLAIIYLYKKLFIEKKLNYILASIAGILVKGSIIFAGFSLLTAINIIPSGSKVAEVLSLGMGMNQLITATLGSILAFAILKIVYKKSE